MSRAVLLFILSTWMLAPAQGAGIRILALEPTVLFPNQKPLRQIAILRLDNDSKEACRCRFSVEMAGAGSMEDISEVVPPGPSTHHILVPDITSPTEIQVAVVDTAGGRTLAKFKRLWQPQRHWKVFIVKSSHEDLGYEDFIYKKQHDIANYIDLAKRLTGPPGSPVQPQPDGRYHYTMESLLFQRNYIEERSEAAWREVVDDYIKPGRMHLMGAPSGVHSHWMDYEELARMTYPARRETRDRFGLDPKTFMIVDNPSLSWSGCQALADAGFRYVARWGQPWRTGGNNNYQTTKLPALFWWLAPDGRHRVLFGWRSHYGLSFWYGQPGDGHGALLDLGAENVNSELQAIQSDERLGPYPYDAVVNPEYVDHDVPHFDSGALRTWLRRYRYPEIRIASPTGFFEYIEKKYGSRLPVLSGDLNNFSADYATIDPDSQGWKRRAARILPLAEGLGAVAGLLDISFQLPGGLIDRTFTRLFDYDEHSWPTEPRPSDVQVFNAQWVKKNEAARALKGAKQALDISFGALASNVPTAGVPSVLVFNPLAHGRTDLATVAGRFSGLLDPDTGKTVPTQIADGQTIFVASNVPAFGYKVFRATNASPTPKIAVSGLFASADSMENQYYRIQFDQKTGAIRSIFDKELRRELVDPNARHRFNELIYLHTKGRESKEGEMYSPTAASSMSGHVGPVRAEFTVMIDDPKTGAAITQTVILYSSLKRIDIVDDLKHVRVLYSNNYRDRYCDNIYYAFPIQVDNFETRVEYPGGVVRPYTDQLRWGSHDFLFANRWVDTSNKSFGVTMAPWNAGTVNFGEIRYNRFSIDYKPSSPHLFSYAYSNRMAELLTLNGDDCNATLRYSFTSHSGGWKSGAATRFGWSVASPLVTRVLPPNQAGSLPARRASFLSIDAPSVQLVTLKDSEQPGRGWIVRMVETEGKESDVKIGLPTFGASGAMECNLVEEDQRPLPIIKGGVRVHMGPYSFSTVRVFAEDGPAPPITDLQGRAASDKSIRLRWRSANGIAYNVYRSEDPDAPPTAYDLIGRTGQPTFLDDWLKIDTPYYYRVAAVSKRNNQGPVGPQIMVRTRKQNTSPPAPVRELGVVRRAKDRLIVYWRTSPEPDVARYYIYRGKNKGVCIKDSNPVAVVKPAPYFLQTYSDEGLQPGITYYYKVVAEDWAGNRQVESPLASGKTPAY